MKLITSLSRHRIERQQYCLNTWKQFGEVVCVQVQEDIERLKPHFPDVTFVSTTLTGLALYGDSFSHRARVKALVDQGPGLLLNSDIKIASTQKEFDSDWKPQSRQFNVGVRYDFEGPGKPKTMNQCGIDAFLITEEVMELLPDVGFVLGVCVWDYWIVWHMLTERFAIKTKTTPGLLHLEHPLNWGEYERQIGWKIMEDYYGLENAAAIMDGLIGLITGRARAIRPVKK